MTAAWIYLGLVVLLIALNALFVAVEFSYITVDRSRVESGAREGDRVAQRVLHGLKTLSTQLSGAQLGITLTSLIVGFIAEPSLATLLSAALGGMELAPALTTTISITGAFVIATFSQMVFGELVPKTWAIAEPERVARLVAAPQAVFMALFGWLVRSLNAAANALVRRLGFEPTDELASARTAEELTALVRHSGKEGTLDERTAELVARSIEFGDRTAAEVMVPRPRVTFVERETSVAELIALVVETGHSRFPVQGEDVDDIVGVVHYKSALAVPLEERAEHTVSEFMTPAFVVSESMTLDPLLRQLREPGFQVAVVIDEYGGTAGVVTLEDLVEEIVGEIQDEHDLHMRRYRRTADAGWMVSGLLRPDEVGGIVSLTLPEGEDSETIAGLIAEELDRLPEAGDEVVLEVTDPHDLDERGLPAATWVSLTVAGLDGHRVDRVIVRRHDDDPRASDDDADGSGEDDAAESAANDDPAAADRSDEEAVR